MSLDADDSLVSRLAPHAAGRGVRVEDVIDRAPIP